MTVSSSRLVLLRIMPCILLLPMPPGFCSLSCVVVSGGVQGFRPLAVFVVATEVSILRNSWSYRWPRHVSSGDVGLE